MSSKSFTGNLPRTGRQRSAEQVTARFNDLLGFINEFFVFGDTPSNFGKVFALDDTTGAITVKDALTFDGTIPENHTLIANATGALLSAFGVTGTDKRYIIGNDGTNGQIISTDGAGNLGFQDPPASTVFVDQTGNFTASNNINYNVDGDAQVTINSANVTANGFTFRFRPKQGVNLVSNPVTLLYNSTNPYEGFTEDIIVDQNAVYTVYSQDGTTLQISAEALSQ